MTRFLRIAVSMVRGWTRLYTLGAPLDEKSVRRAAIESDIWEFLHDPDRKNRMHDGLHVLARAVRGMPDDLRWRIEFTETSYLTAAALTVALLLLAAMRFLNADIVLPPVPSSQPPLILTLDVPPPPPPPPDKQGGGHDRDYWRMRR